MTAQSQPPKAAANVRSSVPLGRGQEPGWVWTQTRANRSGGSPASTPSSKWSATAASSNRTVTAVQDWRTSWRSSTSSGSSSAVTPNPPTSVGPSSRRNNSFAQA